MKHGSGLNSYANASKLGSLSVLVLGGQLVSHGSGGGSGLDGLGLLFLSGFTEEVGEVDSLAIGGELDGAHAGEQALGTSDFLHGGAELDRKSTRLNSSHVLPSRMPSSA